LLSESGVGVDSVQLLQWSSSGHSADIDRP
jgi:hypothetical protein